MSEALTGRQPNGPPQAKVESTASAELTSRPVASSSMSPVTMPSSITAAYRLFRVPSPPRVKIDLDAHGPGYIPVAVRQQGHFVTYALRAAQAAIT